MRSTTALPLSPAAAASSRLASSRERQAAKAAPSWRCSRRRRQASATGRSCSGRLRAPKEAASRRRSRWACASSLARLRGERAGSQLRGLARPGWATDFVQRLPAAATAKLAQPKHLCSTTPRHWLRHASWRRCMSLSRQASTAERCWPLRPAAARHCAGWASAVARQRLQQACGNGAASGTPISGLTPRPFTCANAAASVPLLQKATACASCSRQQACLPTYHCQLAHALHSAERAKRARARRCPRCSTAAARHCDWLQGGRRQARARRVLSNASLSGHQHGTSSPVGPSLWLPAFLPPAQRRQPGCPAPSGPPPPPGAGCAAAAAPRPRARLWVGLDSRGPCERPIEVGGKAGRQGGIT